MEKIEGLLLKDSFSEREGKTFIHEMAQGVDCFSNNRAGVDK
jgi:hypothetical protein